MEFSEEVSVNGGDIASTLLENVYRVDLNYLGTEALEIKLGELVAADTLLTMVIKNFPSSLFQ
eukprot:TRINITY_DN3632_c0_g1_i1.p2 TRINITY_DN3632_c0_g1~~TRINITY_DN3632_c0_g1_i1.p2  ORF type:complete len:63 (-),score=6.82 TRINITY_DN3632_c0_g1_i1:679-867(-)